MAPSAASITISSVDKADQQVEPHAMIKLVLATSSSPPSLTIGEYNRSKNLDGVLLWAISVVRAFLFIAFLAAFAYDTYRPGWLSISRDDGDFPWWWRLTIALNIVYAVVVVLAVGGHLPLLVPQAPYAALEALEYIGFREVGPALVVISSFVIIFNQVWPWLWVTWDCLLVALIAAVIYLCLCIVRTYRTPCISEKL